MTASSREPLRALVGAFGRRVLESPALRVTVGYGLAGTGWVAANLLMARLLPTEAFAYLSLCIAISQTVSPLGLLGADAIAKRGGLRADAGSLVRSARSSVAVAVIGVVVSRGVYGLGGPLLASVLAATVGGGLCAMAAAHLQGAHKFGPAMLANQGHLFSLLVAALVELVVSAQNAELPALVFGAMFLVAAGMSWRTALTRAGGVMESAISFGWADAASFFVIQCAASLIYQLDRLLIPRVLSVQDLAVYSVLVSVAGSPFRMLQMGVGFTTIPRLRAAESASVRRALLRAESKVIAVVALAAVAIVLPLTTKLVHLLLGEKYAISEGMVVAVVVTGLIRVLDGFANATASALAVSSELRWMGLLGWIGAGAAAVGGIVGARWGLIGVIYGIGAGWLVRTVLVGALGASHLRDKPAPASGDAAALPRGPTGEPYVPPEVG